MLQRSLLAAAACGQERGQQDDRQQPPHQISPSQQRHGPGSHLNLALAVIAQDRPDGRRVFPELKREDVLLGAEVHRFGATAMPTGSSR
jgi:hypothetical protein